MRAPAAMLLLLAMLAPTAARAIQLEALDVGPDWRLRAVRFRGNDAVSTSDLRKVMVTQPRRWFALWRAYPLFDPIAFRTDLERLQRFYRASGYYEARIVHDLELPADGHALTAVVYVEEGPPVRVGNWHIACTGVPPPEDEWTKLVHSLPIATPDAVFSEELYNHTAIALQVFLRERGFARVDVRKEATVDLAQHRARVTYEVTTGPPCVFGDVTFAGTRRLDPAILRRELAFEPGDPFRQSKLDASRNNLVALNLLRSVRIDEDIGDREAPRVDLRITVSETPPREVRLGVGYDTDEQVRGLASWRHYNFLGGARQLGFSARASFIQRSLTADFLQPHFPGADNRTRLLLTQSQDEEDAYTLDRVRLTPRFEWQATPRVTGFVFHRTEYDVLSDVSPAIRARLPGVAPEDSVLVGMGFGADWNRADDLLDPHRGFVLNGTVEPVGGVLGGDFAFVRLSGQGSVYQPLVGRLGGAARLRLGTAEPFDDTKEIPLFERFYAGGLNSVRGYGRRRIGPLVDDEPIGGRTLVDASLELRHPITEKIGAAVFVDGGQVALKSFDFPFDDLQYGAGFGVRYTSPVGPLRLDLGFPLEPPPGDQRWQVHVSLGAAF